MNLNVKMEVDQELVEEHHELLMKEQNEYFDSIRKQIESLRNIKKVLESSGKCSKQNEKEIMDFECSLNELKASFEINNCKGLQNEFEEIKSLEFKRKLRKREEKYNNKQVESKKVSKYHDKKREHKPIDGESNLSTSEEKELQNALKELQEIEKETDNKVKLIDKHIKEAELMDDLMKKLEDEKINLEEEISIYEIEIEECDSHFSTINDEIKMLKKSLQDLKEEVNNLEGETMRLVYSKEEASKEISNIETSIQISLKSIIEDAFNDESSREELSTYLNLILDSTNSLCLQTITNIINSICDYLDPQSKQNKERDTCNTNSSLVKQTLTDFLHRFKDCIFNCSDKREEYIELVIKSIKFLYDHNLMPSEELYKEYSQNELNKRLQFPDFEILRNQIGMSKEIYDKMYALYYKQDFDAKYNNQPKIQNAEIVNKEDGEIHEEEILNKASNLINRTSSYSNLTEMTFIIT